MERDDQQTDDDVRQGQVGDEEVGDGLKHSTLKGKGRGYFLSRLGLRTVTCMRRLVRTMKMTVELPRTAVREVAQYTRVSSTTTPI